MHRAKFFLVAVPVLCIGFVANFATTPYEFPKPIYFPTMPVSETNAVTKEGASLGRFLFYDPILSADSSFSCSSCHRREAAFSDSPKRFSKGIYGGAMKRNTPGLFNLAWYPSLFWDGRAPSIEDQVFQPVSAHDEMNLNWPAAEKRIRNSEFYRLKFSEAFGEVTIDSNLIAKAIAQFERTLISHDSRYDKFLRKELQFTKDEYDGYVLVNDQTKGDCLHCHTTDADALGTTRKFSNNGLDSANSFSDYRDYGLGAITYNPADIGKFKIPSLRNVGLTPPYMHDGRFFTLFEVLEFYSEGVNASINVDSKMEFAHQKGNHLSDEEKLKIVAFLETLSDSTFITNPAFGNPFNGK